MRKIVFTKIDSTETASFQTGKIALIQDNSDRHDLTHEPYFEIFSANKRLIVSGRYDEFQGITNIESLAAAVAQQTQQHLFELPMRELANMPGARRASQQATPPPQLVYLNEGRYGSQSFVSCTAIVSLEVDSAHAYAQRHAKGRPIDAALKRVCCVHLHLTCGVVVTTHLYDSELEALMQACATVKKEFTFLAAHTDFGRGNYQAPPATHEGLHLDYKLIAGVEDYNAAQSICFLSVRNAKQRTHLCIKIGKAQFKALKSHFDRAASKSSLSPRAKTRPTPRAAKKTRPEN